MTMRAWLFEPWRTRVLWASLAGNLFLGALIGGHLIWRGPPFPPGLDGAVMRMAHDLPESDSARFRLILERERPWFEQSRRRMDFARSDLAQSIAKEPFDEAEVRMRMQVFQATWIETSTRFGESLLVALGTLSPEGRVRLADTAIRRRP